MAYGHPIIMQKSEAEAPDHNSFDCYLDLNFFISCLYCVLSLDLTGFGNCRYLLV